MRHHGASLRSDFGFRVSNRTRGAFNFFIQGIEVRGHGCREYFLNIVILLQRFVVDHSLIHIFLFREVELFLSLDKLRPFSQLIQLHMHAHDFIY